MGGMFILDIFLSYLIPLLVPLMWLPALFQGSLTYCDYGQHNTLAWEKSFRWLCDAFRTPTYPLKSCIAYDYFEHTLVQVF